MPTWNPVIIASGREKVLKTAFGRNINLAKKKKEEEEGGSAQCDNILISYLSSSSLKSTLPPLVSALKAGSRADTPQGRWGTAGDRQVSPSSEETEQS